jgi:hypothetical protein
MPKHPGAKSSRSERRAGRERAHRARSHGLPERPAEPTRRVSAREPELENDTESSGTALGLPKKAGIPTLVKVAIGALVALAGAYFLTRLRDARSWNRDDAAAEPAASVASASATASNPLQTPVVAQPVTPVPAPLPSAAAPVEPKPPVEPVANP